MSKLLACVACGRFVEVEPAVERVWCGCETWAFTPEDLAEQRDAAREVAVQTHLDLARRIAQMETRLGVYIAALEQIRCAPPPGLTALDLVRRSVSIADQALKQAPPEKA